MTASIFVSSIKLNDETIIETPRDGVVLFVGPNSSGKSQALRDISNLVTSNKGGGLVVTDARVEFEGSGDELLSRLESDRSIVSAGSGEAKVDLGDKGQHSVSSLVQWWTEPSLRKTVAGYFVLLANTESRLLASHPTPGLDLYTKAPTHPLHRLYQQVGLEARLNSISSDAFGRGLILDVWAGGSQWSLRVGNIDPPNSPRPDQGYLDSLRELPLLREEGDGVRSMVGLLLTLFTGHQSISLVDEPEAFLHPPQARYLAKLLAESASAKGAVFLSTHSSEVVHGVLEGQAPTTVVRLQRVGNKNEAAVLDNDAVRRLWDDPILKYSNLLEGLFTDSVVICESDADCKFFASIRDTLMGESSNSRRVDILFTSCGGKHRLHVGFKALRAASVPVVIIGDFDVLNEWSILSRLIVEGGGETADFEADWNVLNSALTSKSRTPSVAGMREAVITAFDGVSKIDNKTLAPVREALKIESGWDKVKKTGLSGVPKGAPYQAAERLLEELRLLGICLIPVGEMEDFIPSVGGHGPAWLSEVLETGLHTGPGADGARNFFGSVLDAVSGRIRSANNLM